MVNIEARAFQDIHPGIAEVAWSRHCKGARIEPSLRAAIATREIAVGNPIRKSAESIRIRRIRTGIGGREILAALEVADRLYLPTSEDGIHHTRSAAHEVSAS